MGPCETETHLYSKGRHHASYETASRNGKIIFISYASDKGLVSRIHKEFKLNVKKTNSTIKNGA